MTVKELKDMLLVSSTEQSRLVNIVDDLLTLIEAYGEAVPVEILKEIIESNFKNEVK